MHNPQQAKISPLPGLLAAAAICWLAWTMALVHLDYESMWLDENYTWRVSSRDVPGLIQATAQDVHPPLYYLWVRGWLTLTGTDNLFVMRLTSALPAVLAVAFCYRIGTDWFKSRWAGIAAALFLATSGLFVYYARELRMYALIVLLICVSWWLLGRLLRGQRGGLAGYAGALIAMAYTYYFAAFAIPAQIITTALFFPRRLPRLLLALGITILAFLPWLPAFMNQLAEARSQSGDTTNAPIIGKFLGTVPTSIDSISRFISTYSAGQPAFVLLLIILAFTLYRANTRRWVTVAGLWFFLTAALFFAVNLVIPVYGLRYALTVIPALALLAGAAADRLPHQRAKLGVIVVIGLTGILSHTAAFPEPKAPHRDLLKTVADHYLPGDRIWYNLTLYARGSLLSDDVVYHLKHDAPNLNTDWFIWDAPNEFRDPAATPRVWDIRPYWIPVPADALAELVDGRTVTEEVTFGAYTVRLYEAPPPDQTPVVLGDSLNLLVSPQDTTQNHAGDTINVKTWWRARQAVPLDYSYALYLRQAGNSNPLTQMDAGLAIENRPTSQWLPSETYTFAALPFALPGNLPAGDYELWLAVYFWQNQERLPVQVGSDHLLDEESLSVRAAEFQVK